MSNQKEDYLAEFNPQFNLFAIDNIDFENFPPVENKYGTATVNGAVLFCCIQKIKPRNQFTLMAFLWKTKAGVQLFFGRKQLEMEITVMSKSTLINLCFTTNNTVFGNNSKKSLVVNHESFTFWEKQLKSAHNIFNKTMNSMKSTLDHFSSQHRD
jgi:hypothetical protein